MDDDVWPVVMEALSAIQDVPNLSHQFGAKKRVARGGYSEVYRAEWIQSGTRAPVNVCYKVLKPPISNMPSDVEEMRKTMKHLRREMKVWKDLDHENIVKFIGFAIDDRNGGPEAALVSEWCSNGNLDQYLRCKGSCNRMALVLDVARGLTYLHGRDSVVVHGDLKPPNILISDTGHAKLCDFGLSSIADGMTTGFTSSGPAFTLRYCAPEAVVTDNHVKTTAGDVYSFACTCAMVSPHNS
ncbi:kinase-like domain-containing protein [Cantharellus anzutake]|uniref:kinase-like domain-containing protein n=1 Tax=Cantharellus anzutake TaxID=1750568 RepID=UPI001905B73A|nr:kinase-like domain-containing protein [Cantharellus anzutake]KAF8331332.1 kinase-like domain-containing protein [Cantharellus anzutake]